MISVHDVGLQLVFENIPLILCHFAKVGDAVRDLAGNTRLPTAAQNRVSGSGKGYPTSPRTGWFPGHVISFITLTAISMALAI